MLRISCSRHQTKIQCWFWLLRRIKMGCRYRHHAEARCWLSSNLHITILTLIFSSIALIVSGEWFDFVPSADTVWFQRFELEVWWDSSCSPSTGPKIIIQFVINVLSKVDIRWMFVIDQWRRRNSEWKQIDQSWFFGLLGWTVSIYAINK